MKLLPLLLFSLLLQAGGQAVAIPIRNASFEAPAGRYGVPDWTVTVNLPGWGASAVQPKSPNPVPAPDGNSVAYVGNSTLSQDLGVKASDLQAVSRDGIYTLTFYVGNHFGVYPGYYEAKISIGKHELCPISGWATQKWTRVVLSCPAPGYLVFDQWVYPDTTPENSHPDNLILSLSVSGWQLLFDDIQLTFAPQ